MLARWRLGHAGILSIAVNLGSVPVSMPVPAGRRLFAIRRLRQAGRRRENCRPAPQSPFWMLIDERRGTDALADAAGIDASMGRLCRPAARRRPEALREVLRALGHPAGFRRADCGQPAALKVPKGLAALPPLVTASAGRPTRLDIGHAPPHALLLSESGARHDAIPTVVRARH